MANKDGITCPRCGSGELRNKGKKNGKTEFKCKICGKYFRHEEDVQNNQETSEVEYGKNDIRITHVSDHPLTEEEVRKLFKINSNEWELDRLKVKTISGYRKDRKGKWVIGDNGLPAPGSYSEDTGNMLVVVMYNTTASFVKKVAEVRIANAMQLLMEDTKQYAIKYPKIQYPKHKEGLLYELDMPDLHFGKLAWAEETGQDYDIQIAAQSARDAFTELLGYVEHFPVSKILLPLGNDFFNVNGAGETTVNGTKQMEDTRWQKTFRKGRQLLVELVEMCQQVASVDILIIPGNHDRERMFYLGDALECWFHNCPNVSVDNSASVRKFYEFGIDMIMFTHGSEEKFPVLPSLMSIEQPEMWGRTKHREVHLGDRHHKEVLYQHVKEEKGVTIRLMRSLTPPDEWHYRTGWLGAEQAAESYLWHPQKGVIAQFASVRV